MTTTSNYLHFQSKPEVVPKPRAALPGVLPRPSTSAPSPVGLPNTPAQPEPLLTAPQMPETPRSSRVEEKQQQQIQHEEPQQLDSNPDLNAVTVQPDQQQFMYSVTDEQGRTQQFMMLCPKDMDQNLLIQTLVKQIQNDPSTRGGGKKTIKITQQKGAIQKITGLPPGSRVVSQTITHSNQKTAAGNSGIAFALTMF